MSQGSLLGYARIAGSALAIALCVPAPLLAANAPNTTSLPSYPGMKSGLMDATYRSIPSGQQCIHFTGDVPDALAKVEDWYRGKLAGAVVTPVNSDNMYGGYFKFDGIKLKKGNDFANVYRMQGGRQDTTIELFQCKS